MGRVFARSGKANWAMEVAPVSNFQYGYTGISLVLRANSAIVGASSIKLSECCLTGVNRFFFILGPVAE